MARSLEVLIVEDDPLDVELIIDELRRGGLDVSARRVDTEASLRDALKSPLDIAFCDWHMPRLEGALALSLIRETSPDLPIIIVSSSLSDEIAGELLRSGVDDYFQKDRLHPRLVPALERALRDGKSRAERRVIREQLLVSDRMASLGLLAAGVAHEINNPLTAVVANLDRAAARLASGVAGETGEIERFRSELEDARVASLRIRDIVRELSIFSREERPQGRRVVVLPELLDSVVRLSSNETRYRARVLRAYGTVPNVAASESRLAQVFLNLVVNAAQAIPIGHVESHEIRIGTSTTLDGRAVVDVSDTGEGIESEHLARLFDPFFTTKRVGVGTGLGLSICHRIVTDFGGTISVESQRGVGSTFRVILPASVPALEDMPRVPPRPSSVPARRCRVLIIDDEPALIRTAQAILAEDHDVVGMTSASLALAKLDEGAAFDVILCDLMMPEMSGMEFYDEVQRTLPAEVARLAFVTGGAFTNDARAFLDAHSCRTLQKPYTSVELESIVREVAEANVSPKGPFLGPQRPDQA